MENYILLNIDNPRQLEKLYRQNKLGFRQQFSMVYPELKENKIADFWNEKLNYQTKDVYWGTTKDVSFVLLLQLSPGLLQSYLHFLILTKSSSTRET